MNSELSFGEMIGGDISLIKKSITETIVGSKTYTVSEMKKITMVVFVLTSYPTYNQVAVKMGDGTIDVPLQGTVPSGYGITDITDNTFTIAWSNDNIQMTVYGY